MRNARDAATPWSPSFEPKERKPFRRFLGMRRIAKTENVIALPSIAGAIPGETVNYIWWSDVMNFLCQLPDNYVDCCISSPPYWNLRDYGTPGQIGMEPTPQEYVASLVAVYREIKRILKPSGTCWINLGDAYANDTKWGGATSGKHAAGLQGSSFICRNRTNTGLPSKSLIGLPWRVAFGLQDDGWILRSDIIWNKPSVMPESVDDRPTRSHEYVFLLTKAPDYFYDQEAIREPASEASIARISQPNFSNQTGGPKDYGKTGINRNRSARKAIEGFAANPGRNKRDVWTVASEPFDGAHFAVFPQALVMPMALAGCPDKVCNKCGAPWRRVVEDTPEYAEIKRSMLGKTHTVDNPLQQGMGQSYGKGKARVTKDVMTIGFAPTCTCNAPAKSGLVLDPFSGSGTTALVARSLGRSYIGCDLNPEYVAIARDRLRMPFEEKHVQQKETIFHDLPLFQQVAST